MKCELCSKETGKKNKRFCGNTQIKGSCAYKNYLMLGKKYREKKAAERGARLAHCEFCHGVIKNPSVQQRYHKDCVYEKQKIDARKLAQKRKAEKEAERLLKDLEYIEIADYANSRTITVKAGDVKTRC